jgi:hypothetical protein
MSRDVAVIRPAIATHEERDSGPDGRAGSPPSGGFGASRQVFALLVLAAVMGAYFVVRPGGRWAESDSGTMTEAIRAMAGSGQLVPSAGAVYDNGYGYQVVSVAIMAFTGLSAQSLQQLVYPLVSAAIVLPAWALYRELTGSVRAATLATLLLWLVPEHLFAVLRGSHERLDRAFLFIALWLLVRSLRFRGDPVRFAIHVALALIATYGLVATNALFGMSFVIAIATGLAISWIARWGPVGVRSHAVETTRLLGWTMAASAVLVVVFVGFVYPPIEYSLRALATIPGTLLSVILSGGATVNPYANVLGAWISPLAYLMLSMADFVMLGGSALVWVWLGASWLRGRRPASTGVWTLWLLYLAFAIQGAAAIVSDRTGALQGNAQYRAFAVFGTMAAPILSLAIIRWWGHPRPTWRTAAAGALGVAAILALLKTTLDPALSNRWLFYTTSEIDALRWADTMQADTTTWVGPDDRLVAAYQMAVGVPTQGNHWGDFEPTSQTGAFLISDVIRLQSARLDESLPPLASADLIYDNGDVQLFRVASP